VVAPPTHTHTHTQSHPIDFDNSQTERQSTQAVKLPGCQASKKKMMPMPKMNKKPHKRSSQILSLCKHRLAKSIKYKTYLNAIKESKREGGLEGMDKDKALGECKYLKV